MIYREFQPTETPFPSSETVMIPSSETPFFRSESPLPSSETILSVRRVSERSHHPKTIIGTAPQDSPSQSEAPSNPPRGDTPDPFKVSYWFEVLAIAIEVFGQLIWHCTILQGTPIEVLIKFSLFIPAKNKKDKKTWVGVSDNTQISVDYGLTAF